MKVKRMIEELRKFNPDAEVKLHHRKGNNVLFVLGFARDDKTVVIEDKGDSDLRSELCARFVKAHEEQVDELDFFMDLFELGFTLDDIKKNTPEKYEFSKTFCEEHGLV